MPIIDSSTVNPETLDENVKGWVYNSLDSCVTRELFPVLESLLDEKTRVIYEFEKAMQGPGLTIARRGVRVDDSIRAAAIQKYTGEQERINHILQRLAGAVQSRAVNWNSPKQLIELFYDHMALPKIWRRSQGRRYLTVDRTALEQLENYFYARPIVNCLLSLRGGAKKLGVLRSGIDEDGRIRAGVNVGAGEMGRWSSSDNVYRMGTSMHTVTDELRRMYIPDADYKMAYLDLKTAESFAVAFLCGDKAYIKACESGDIHTEAAQLVWPGLAWTKDKAKNREVAETLFYRYFSHRDMTKRGGHLTNYGGTPYAMEEKLKIERSIGESFQREYFLAFPGVRERFGVIGRQISTCGQLTTPLGRRRTFFGRTKDDTTLRKAYAYEPQSTVADILNLGLLRVWWELDGKDFQVLAQVHDAILVQYKHERDLKRAVELMTIPVPVNDRTMTIPVGVTIGYNWAKHDPKKKIFADGNPGGLVDWEKIKSGQVRQERPSVSILDQRVSSIYA